MNRKARHQKAAEIRRALTNMRKEVKVASKRRQAELFSDMDMAMDDYETFMDEGMWGMDDDFQAAEPTQPEAFMDDDMGGLDETMDLYNDDMDMGMGECGEPDMGMGYEDDDMMGGMDEMGEMGEFESNIYASNKEHVSYILNKVAEIVASIENYDNKAKKAKKASRSGGARKVIAGHMRQLASVVASSNFKHEETGAVLSMVGKNIIDMHVAMVQGS